MKEEYKKVNFNKGGVNSGYSCRLVIPKPFIDELGITKEDNNVVLYLEGDKIIIKKASIKDDTN